MPLYPSVVFPSLHATSDAGALVRRKHVISMILVMVLEYKVPGGTRIVIIQIAGND